MRLLITLATLMLASCAGTGGSELYYAAPISAANAAIEGVTYGDRQYSCVASVDGASLPKRRWQDVPQPVALTPGAHALSICFLDGYALARATVKLDAVPQGTYVVRMQVVAETRTQKSVNLWIEDKKSGQAVSDKKQVLVGTASHEPPIVKMLSDVAPI